MAGRRQTDINTADPAPEGMSEDLIILSRWVKKELFVKVKFLYNIEKDLMIDGFIYNMFLFDCKDRLVGLKLNADSGTECRTKYVRDLWIQATKKRKNRIVDGLNTRRSSIYSATQNRFADLCKLCAEKCIILPSLEAFEEGIKLPAIYLLFHHYFIRSSVGDSAWRESCIDAENSTDPIAPQQGEAFAMLLLRNNYFAWLWEAKLEDWGKCLVTDYDSNQEWASKEITEGFLKCQINLEVEEDENDLTRIMVTKASDPRKYNQLRRLNEAAMEKVRETARSSDRYKNFKKSFDEETEETRLVLDLDEAQDEEEKENVLVEKRSKKRKVLKAFREYTTPKDEEGKFKGWSKRAANDMKELIMSLNTVTSRQRLFRKLYRSFYTKNSKGGGKKKGKVDEEEDQGPANYEEDVWGLAAITPVEL